MSQAFSPDIEETTGISPPRACSNTPGFVSMNENTLDTAFTSANIQAKYRQVKDSVNKIRLSPNNVAKYQSQVIARNSVIWLQSSTKMQDTVKPVLSGHSKIDKTNTLLTNGSLMKVKSIAECSLGAFCNTFDLY